MRIEWPIMTAEMKHESPDSSPQDRSGAYDAPVLKRRRITKACDFCHRRGRKCKIPPSANPNDARPVVCLTCVEHGATCTWERVAAKRGVKSRPCGSPGATSPQNHEAWAYDAARHGDAATVRGLIRVFFDTVYPM